LYSCDHYWHLHSFPTRRSSDLSCAGSRLRPARILALVATCLPPLWLQAELVLYRACRAAAGSKVGDPNVDDVCAILPCGLLHLRDRKSTRLNSSHVKISYAVFC